VPIRDVDVMSAALYRNVFREYRDFRTRFGDVSVLPTRLFLAPMEIGEEVSIDIERGKTLVIVLTAVGELDAAGQRAVFFELNGQPRQVRVRDKAATDVPAARERASKAPGSIGAPMPGSVVDVKVAEGQAVDKGDALVVLSAMKMETVVSSPVAGTIERVVVAKSDTLAAGDLLVEIDVASEEKAA
jgi:pyruvate carboxylase